jgi:flagellar basal-body rod protein FlgB
VDLLTSQTSQVLQTALTGVSLRQKAIASNLANVDTPNYHRQDVRFEGALKAALSKSLGAQNQSADGDLRMATAKNPTAQLSDEESSLGQVTPEWVSEDPNYAYRNDGNSVDVEVEMVKMAQNTQRFLALSKLEGDSFKGLRKIINNNSA